MQISQGVDAAARRHPTSIYDRRMKKVFKLPTPHFRRNLRRERQMVFGPDCALLFHFFCNAVICFFLSGQCWVFLFLNLFGCFYFGYIYSIVINVFCCQYFNYVNKNEFSNFYLLLINLDITLPIFWLCYYYTIWDGLA